MSMFSVDINSANGLNYIRPKKGAKKTATTHTPATLTKNGSVFNDPNIFNTEATTTSGVMNMRTSRRIAQAGVRGGNSIFNNNNINFVSGGDVNGSSSVSGGVNSLTVAVDPSLLPDKDSAGSGDLGIGKDAGKGRAAAKQLKEETSDLKGGINDVENEGDRAADLGKRSKKLSGSIAKADQKYKESIEKQKVQMREIEDERKSLIDKMALASRSITDYSAELEAETMSSDQNLDRIMTLRSLINENRNTLTISGRQVNVLGRSSRAIATGMAKTAKYYTKTNKSYQKDMNKNQSKLEKTLEVAAKIGEISMIVETTGSIIENLGKMFKACASIPYIGAALAAAGAVMEPIGAAGKAVGQWGKTAAQITQGVAYAASGNVQAAFMSAAAALQSGMQATASTKQAIAGFENLDASLADVKADAAEADAKRAEEKAAKAEEKAAKSQKKEVESGEAKETGKTHKTKDAEGNEVETKEYDYSEKTDDKTRNAAEKRTEAAQKRKEADQKRLEANYKEAKNEIEHSNMSAAEKKDALAKLDAEKTAAANGIEKTYGGELAKDAPVNTDSTLLKETGIDVAKKGEISKKATEVAKKKAEAAAQKKAAAKSKSLVKKIFSQEGMAMVGQAMTLAGSICAMTQREECGSGSGRVSDFKISQRAQKIVAQTMNRMGYARPAHFQVKKR